MRKTSIAIAALAISGAAMAQVTLKGSIGISYQQDRTQPNPVSGLVVSDGNVALSATQDLGQGYKITGNTSFDLKGREQAMAATDLTLNLLTPVGMLTAGAVESPNLIIARGWAGAPVSLPTGFDGGIIGGSQNLDVIAFNTQLAGFVMGVSYTEAGTKDIVDLGDGLGTQINNTAFFDPAANRAPGGPGPGKGPIQTVSLSLGYDQGPVSLGFTLSRDSVYTTTLTDVAARGLVGSAYSGRMSTSVSGSYDFGVVKVGAGFTMRNKGWANETVVGASAPVGGKVKIGVILAAKTDDSATLGDGVTAASVSAAGLGAAIPGLIAGDLKGSAARMGVGLGVDYALDDSTTFNVSYGTYDVKAPQRTSNPSVASRTDEYRIRLMKSF